MNRQLFPIAALAALVLLQPVAAQAYIGPGVGAGAVAAVLGVLGAIFLAIVAVLYYPIKRVMEGRKAKSSPAVSDKPAE